MGNKQWIFCLFLWTRIWTDLCANWEASSWIFLFSSPWGPELGSPLPNYLISLKRANELLLRFFNLDSFSSVFLSPVFSYWECFYRCCSEYEWLYIFTPIMWWWMVFRICRMWPQILQNVAGTFLLAVDLQLWILPAFSPNVLSSCLWLLQLSVHWGLYPMHFFAQRTFRCLLYDSLEVFFFFYLYAKHCAAQVQLEPIQQTPHAQWRLDLDVGFVPF